DRRGTADAHFQAHRVAIAAARLVLGRPQQRRAQAPPMRALRDGDRVEPRAARSAPEENKNATGYCAGQLGRHDARAVAAQMPAPLRAADAVVVEAGL